MKVSVLLLIFFSTKCAADWELIWEDNFDGDSIDTSKWDHEVTAWGGGVSITVLPLTQLTIFVFTGKPVRP